METPLSSNDEHNDEHFVEMTPEDYSYLIYTLFSYPIAIAFNSIEFVITLIQIVAALVVVNGNKGKHSEEIWILVYTFGCIANLPILCWRFWQILHPIQYLRINKVMFHLRLMFEFFFAGWSFVFLWVFIFSSSSLSHSSQLFGLCVTFIAFGCIRYAIIGLAISCYLSLKLCLMSIALNRSFYL